MLKPCSTIHKVMPFMVGISNMRRCPIMLKPCLTIHKVMSFMVFISEINVFCRNWRYITPVTISSNEMVVYMRIFLRIYSPRDGFLCGASFKYILQICTFLIRNLRVLEIFNNMVSLVKNLFIQYFMESLYMLTAIYTHKWSLTLIS